MILHFSPSLRNGLMIFLSCVMFTAIHTVTVYLWALHGPTFRSHATIVLYVHTVLKLTVLCPLSCQQSAECNFVGFQVSCFEEFCLLGYNAMWSVESILTFRRNMSHPSWAPKNKPSKKQVANRAVFFNWYRGDGVQLGPLGTSATNRPIIPAPGDYEAGEFGGMITGRGNRSTRRKPAPVPLCPPQIPHDLTGREPGQPRWEPRD
jgi:hypothetical protein